MVPRELHEAGNMLRYRLQWQCLDLLVLRGNAVAVTLQANTLTIYGAAVLSRPKRRATSVPAGEVRPEYKYLTFGQCPAPLLAYT